MPDRIFPRIILVCATAVLCWFESAQASPLPIGSAILPAPGAGPAGGTLLASETSNFSTANYSGSLVSEVLLNDPANPFGPGNLTFTYELFNNAGSTDGLDRLTVSSFGVPGLLTDASYQALSVGVIPTSFDRSSDTLGDVIGTSFTSAPLGLGMVAPGTNSKLLVIQTDATTFQATTATVIDSLAANPASFAPLTVPEPTTLALAGLLGLAALRRR